GDAAGVPSKEAVAPTLAFASPPAPDPETGRFRPGPDPLLSPARAAAPRAHLLDLLDDAGRAESVAELRAVVRALIERLWDCERD
ncbi:MAG TPA: hypothetical protein VFK80_05450, partial [Limnochordia bacterium]|nr:hypothetical protein [Limnochordia bacterium]